MCCMILYMFGIIKYIENNNIKNVNIGDLVGFIPGVEYEFIIYFNVFV